MKIVFTDIAKSRLKDIYKYYKQEASLRVAKSTKDRIFDGINILKTHPELGSEENYLAFLHQGYKKLIIGNYKIIYRVIDRTVYIDTIFDSRQEPLEMVNDVKNKK